MVFFTCGNCNESLKKVQVELHCSRKCRNAAYVSCVDCGKDFYGDDYVKHTKCVSEEQKYGGKNWTPKENSNKGDKKQEQWLQQVHKAISQSDRNTKLHDILQSLLNYPNVPRKKPKFINFLKSSFPRYKHEPALIEEVWNVIDQKDASDDGDNTADNQASAKHSTECKPEEETFGKKNSKRSKKQKYPNGDDITEQELEEMQEAKRAKNEEGKKDDKEENVERLNETLQEDEETKPFKMETVVMDIVQKKGEISLKKLRKKVVNEYVASGKFLKSEEKLWRKLDNHIAGSKLFVVKGDRVLLVDEHA